MKRWYGNAVTPSQGRGSTLWALMLSMTFLGMASMPGSAQVVVAPVTPQVGSSNPISSEPGVKRPSSTPCTVNLFTNMEFADYSQHSFGYTPGCQGPYEKIVLTGDFTVTAGTQYDRTAQLYIGGANVYFGTTAEPRSTLSPSWHVERDITDLSALLASSQSGTATIFNIVNSTYTGIIYGTVKLQFYPAMIPLLAPRVPDLVLPLSANGEDQYLSTPADQLTQTLSLPKNIERAYLDVIAQSQQGDEFWYSCAPTDVAAELENCGSTGFREVEVAIDGTPAGLAPVYPWIYTGGFDPYLWEPIVGVQTLNFKPFRVDLTPFAGLLSNGSQHTVAVSVFNADNYFDVTAALLLFEDHGSAQVTGETTKNTLLAAPQQQVYENLATDEYGDVTGNVLVTSLRTFSLAGYVNTSHGQVQTTVDETADFGNYQTYDVNSADYIQSIEQLNVAYSVTHTKDGLLDLETDELFLYPLTLNYSQVEHSDGTYTLNTQVMQQDAFTETSKLNGFTLLTNSYDETVNSHDNWDLTAGFSTIDHAGTSSALYQSTDSLGHCYSRGLAATNSVLTAVTDGAACGGTNQQ